MENLGEGRTDESAAFDPREISGYKLKELIWTDWRSEWEPRPASPSSIRLIILGRLVEDKAALKGVYAIHLVFARACLSGDGLGAAQG